MTEAHQMSQPSPARVCLRWLDTADERDVAHVVEIADPLDLPIERPVLDLAA